MSEYCNHCNICIVILGGVVVNICMKKNFDLEINSTQVLPDSMRWYQFIMSFKKNSSISVRVLLNNFLKCWYFLFRQVVWYEGYRFKFFYFSTDDSITQTVSSTSGKIDKLWVTVPTEQWANSPTSYITIVDSICQADARIWAPIWSCEWNS